MKAMFRQQVGTPLQMPSQNYFKRNMSRLKRAFVIGLTIGSLAMAGKAMAQPLNYDYNLIRNPEWVRQEVKEYYSRPQRERIHPQNIEERDRSIGFSNIYWGAMYDIKKNPDYAILNEVLREREDRSKAKTREDIDTYTYGFLLLYSWFNERISGLPKEQLVPGSNPQLTQETLQQVEVLLKPFLKEAPKQEQPVVVKLTLAP